MEKLFPACAHCLPLSKKNSALCTVESLFICTGRRFPPELLQLLSSFSPVTSSLSPCKVLV